MIKSKTCSFENCKQIVWSNGMCKSHIPKTTIKSTPKKYDVNAILQMQEFFLNIWNTKNNVSEVSNIYLGNEPLSIYFHHILPKEKYPQAKFDKNNIILLSLDEHSNVENDMYKYPEVNKRRNELIIKYNL